MLRVASHSLKTASAIELLPEVVHDRSINENIQQLTFWLDMANFSLSPAKLSPPAESRLPCKHKQAQHTPPQPLPTCCQPGKNGGIKILADRMCRSVSSLDKHADAFVAPCGESRPWLPGCWLLVVGESKIIVTTNTATLERMAGSSECDRADLGARVVVTSASIGLGRRDKGSFSSRRMAKPTHFAVAE
jgi:hypothetical protein